MITLKDGKPTIQSECKDPNCDRGMNIPTQLDCPTCNGTGHTTQIPDQYMREVSDLLTTKEPKYKRGNKQNYMSYVNARKRLLIIEAEILNQLQR